MQVLPDEEGPIVDEDQLVGCDSSPFIGEAVVSRFLCEFACYERKFERFLWGGRVKFEKSDVVFISTQWGVDEPRTIGLHG